MMINICWTTLGPSTHSSSIVKKMTLEISILFVASFRRRFVVILTISLPALLNRLLKFLNSVFFRRTGEALRLKFKDSFILFRFRNLKVLLFNDFFAYFQQDQRFLSPSFCLLHFKHFFSFIKTKSYFWF